MAGSEFANGTALSNGGERLKIEDAGNSTIQEFAYGDSPPWPGSPDGHGPSLVLINPLSNPDPSIASNWRPSKSMGGNPGGSDATRFTGDPLADTDANGVADLIDYALGDASAISLSGAGRFSYRRVIGTDDVDIRIESSTDLASWSEASPLLGEAQREYLGNGTELVVFQIIGDDLPEKARFLRLSVAN